MWHAYNKMMHGDDGLDGVNPVIFFFSAHGRSSLYQTCPACLHMHTSWMEYLGMSSRRTKLVRQRIKSSCNQSRPPWHQKGQNLQSLPLFLPFRQKIICLCLKGIKISPATASHHMLRPSHHSFNPTKEKDPKRWIQENSYCASFFRSSAASLKIWSISSRVCLSWATSHSHNAWISGYDRTFTCVFMSVVPRGMYEWWWQISQKVSCMAQGFTHVACGWSHARQNAMQRSMAKRRVKAFWFLVKFGRKTLLRLQHDGGCTSSKALDRSSSDPPDDMRRDETHKFRPYARPVANEGLVVLFPDTCIHTMVRNFESCSCNFHSMFSLKKCLHDTRCTFPLKYAHHGNSEDPREGHISPPVTWTVLPGILEPCKLQRRESIPPDTRISSHASSLPSKCWPRCSQLCCPAKNAKSPQDFFFKTGQKKGSPQRWAKCTFQFPTKGALLQTTRQLQPLCCCILLSLHRVSLLQQVTSRIRLYF